MPINVNDPKYVEAEKEYHESLNSEEKLMALKKMISHMPKHKSAENLRQQLTTRRKKLEQEIEKKKKSGKGGKIGIRKEDMQAVIVGKTNSGKSSLLALLTNAHPKISPNKFTTTNSIIGMMGYETTNIQLIEVPAIDSEYYDKGIVYTADSVLVIINKFEELEEFYKKIRTNGKKIVVFNKIDLFSEQEKRKIQSKLQSKKYNFVITSTKTKEGIKELKEILFKSFKKLRIYTKEPGKNPDKKRPMILNPGCNVEDVAEKILKGFSKKIKEVRIWGPSSKFSGHIVGLKHKVKD